MTIMIATNRPAIAGMKYWSAGDGACVGAGDAVGCAGSTAKLASAFDDQYPLVPLNSARTVYLPVMSGVHCKLYAPFMSVTAVPIGRVLLFWSMTESCTVTPVKSVGCGFCW